MAQRLRVVGAQVLDVAGQEAGALEREDDPGEVERVGVGEDVALGEGAGLGV